MSKELGFEVTRHMLRSFLKKIGYRWKRFRKSLKKHQDEEDYQQKLIQLKDLIRLYQTGYIDLFFADESGFNMEGYIPYGWQPAGQYIEITPSKTKGTQIFGLMSLDNQLHPYSLTGSMNSQAVIAFLDDFHSNIKKQTVVIIDNAPIHHSRLFKNKIEQWKKEDLFIFYLPKYSPHLNPIEILWRMIKYKWLKFEDIASQAQLNEQLEDILIQFGEKYTIDFKELKVSII